MRRTDLPQTMRGNRPDPMDEIKSTLAGLPDIKPTTAAKTTKSNADKPAPGKPPVGGGAAQKAVYREAAEMLPDEVTEITPDLVDDVHEALGRLYPNLRLSRDTVDRKLRQALVDRDAGRKPDLTRQTPGLDPAELMAALRRVFGAE